MSSLMWPWPERMVSGLKPTKSSWLAVVQKKHPNPHVWAEWFLFLCPGNKNGNGKQVTFLAAQNSYLGWDNWREVQGGQRCSEMVLKWETSSLFAMKSFSCGPSLIYTYSSSCVSCPWFEFESFWSTVGKGQFQMWLLHSWNKTEKQIMKKYVDDLVTKSVKVGYI